MEVFQILEQKIYIFFFIFYRTLLLFFIFPVFSATFLSNKIKIIISFALALSLTPAIYFKIPSLSNIYELALVFLSDFIFIFLISLIFRVILCGLQLGGELVGIQMGFGISQTMDPISGFSALLFLNLFILSFFFYF